MRLFVVGASGGVGSRLRERALARGHCLTAQTRTAGKIDEADSLSVAVGQPDDEAFLTRRIASHDAVVLCIGVDSSGVTTLFSDSTRAIIAAMRQTGTRRLVAITGVGAGDTKGHGGWFYNNVLFPFFTRNRYADKDRQEVMIEQSDLDWTVVRPAPFTARAGHGPWQVVTEIPPSLQLRSVTRDEVAGFVLDCVENGRFVRQKPFIGRA